MLQGTLAEIDAFPPVHEGYFEKPSPLSKSQRRQANRAKSRANKQALAPKPLKPRNEAQHFYMELLNDPLVTQVFALGDAGTGKTYIASRIAARRLIEEKISKIFIARPTVSQKAHQLGFLPGGLKQKLAPWLVPITDALKQEMSAATLDKYMGEGKIEFVSFEHMRGRTFEDCFVILDEAQNCTLADLKLFLTRKGENSTYVIAGDTTQVDIENSGLAPIHRMILDQDLSAEIAEFDASDVVRSADAKEWVQAFHKLQGV